MNNALWAKSTFGQADLGDPRRTTRLVKLAETLATLTVLSVMSTSMLTR